MTVEYIVKRIYKKSRVIHDLDLFAFKKLNSVYPIILTLFLSLDVLLVLNKYFGLAENIVEHTTTNEIIFLNGLMLYITYRRWRNRNKVKYEFVEPVRYVSDLKEYSQEDLRKLVVQINRRKRISERIIRAMVEYELVMPGGLILAGAFRLYEVVAKGELELDFVYIFYVSVSITATIGFMMGSRRNPSSFKSMQNSICFKVRNLFIDSIVISSLNPGSDAIRKPGK